MYNSLIKTNILYPVIKIVNTFEISKIIHVEIDVEPFWMQMFA